MKTKFLLFTLVLLLTFGATVPLHANDAPPTMSIVVQRVAFLGPWGVVHVTDNFTIHNNGTTPVSSLDFGFARNYRGNAYYIDAKDVRGATLALDNDINRTSDVYWMRAHFSQAVAFNKTYSFVVTTILGNMIIQAPGGFQFNFTAAPVLTMDAREANVTFVALQGSTFALPSNSTYLTTNFAGLPALFNHYKPWKAYSEDTFYAGYRTVNQYILAVPSVTRDIILGTTGTLSVKDVYKLHNNGISVTSFTITLPDGATNVMAFDVVGALWAVPQTPLPPYQITVQPRYSAGVKHGENFTFTLTYDLPTDKYLKRLSLGGDYNLTISLINNREDFLFDNATVNILTPHGVSVGDVKIPQQSPLSSPIIYDSTQRDFSLHGVTEQDNVTIGLKFSYSPFWSAYGTLPWLVGLEVAIVAVAVAIKIRRGPELEIPVPVERLREFVGLYDERLALSRELVLMEEEVARGGLVKHEFRRRKKVMELRLDAINKSLMEVKTELRAISTYYDELIRRIDRAEAETEVSRASMNQVRSQYRSGKTTRETYDSLTNDIRKRIDRAEETVETILITLREQAR